MGVSKQTIQRLQQLTDEQLRERISELGATGSKLRDSRPRSIAKMFGSHGPTPEQLAEWKDRMSRWNALYRATTAEHKAAVIISNERYGRRRYASSRSPSVSTGGPSIPSAPMTAAEIERDVARVTTDPVTIVVAWTQDEQEILPGQKPWRHDLGERPRFVEVKKPYAAMWANRGVFADAVKARAFIAREHPETGRVFLYPTTDRDPLGHARRDVLSGS